MICSTQWIQSKYYRLDWQIGVLDNIVKNRSRILIFIIFSYPSSLQLLMSLNTGFYKSLLRVLLRTQWIQSKYYRLDWQIGVLDNIVKNRSRILIFIIFSYPSSLQLLMSLNTGFYKSLLRVLLRTQWIQSKYKRFL